MTTEKNLLFQNSNGDNVLSCDHVIQRIEYCGKYKSLLTSLTIRRVLERYQPDLLLPENMEKNLVLCSYIYLFLVGQLEDRIREVLVESEEVSTDLMDILDGIRQEIAANNLNIEEVDDWYEQKCKLLMQRAFDILEQQQRNQPLLPEYLNVTLSEIDCLRIEAHRMYGLLKRREASKELDELHKRRTKLKHQLESGRIGRQKRYRTAAELIEVNRQIKRYNSQKRLAKKIICGMEVPSLFTPKLRPYETNAY